MRIRMHLLCSRRFILRRSRRLTVLSTLSTDSRQLARHTKTTPPPLISIMSALKENMMAAVAANGTQKVVNSSCASSLRSQTDAEAVREFTGGAGQPIPNQPCVMDKTEVDFISKMILDETMELLVCHYRFRFFDFAVFTILCSASLCPVPSCLMTFKSPHLYISLFNIL